MHKTANCNGMIRNETKAEVDNNKNDEKLTPPRYFNFGEDTSQFTK